MRWIGVPHIAFAVTACAALLLAACVDPSTPDRPAPTDPPPSPVETEAQESPAPDLRATAESLVAQVQAARLTSCDAVVRLYEPAQPDIDARSFIAERSAVLAGIEPSLIAGSDGTQVQGFDDSGFRAEFRDGGNQVRHLAAAIQAGVTLGPAAQGLHRLLRPDTPQDAALNDVGTALGAGLASGEIPLAQAGTWIRETICE